MVVAVEETAEIVVVAAVDDVVSVVEAGLPNRFPVVVLFVPKTGV